MARPVEPRLEHAEQALGFVAIALERALVGDLAPGEFVEVADLAEHRSDDGHLEEHPLDGLVAARRIGRHQLAGLVGEIEQDRAGFEQAERLAAGSVRIDDRGDLAVRVERQEFRRPLSFLPMSTRCGSYGRPISSSVIDTFTPFGVGSE